MCASMLQGNQRIKGMCMCVCVCVCVWGGGGGGGGRGEYGVNVTAISCETPCKETFGLSHVGFFPR